MSDKIIGSIMLDTTPERRADITLSDGRIVCDGNDITPDERARTLSEARRDVSDMYAGAVWGLELATEISHAEQNARSWMESIIEMVSALDEPEQDDDGNDIPRTIDGDEVTQEEAQERIQESPLSVEVRSGWCSLAEWADAPQPEEFCVLLSTGGPALRIIGDLNHHGEPECPRLEYQDWGTPWTEAFGDWVDDDALLTYCQQFCFGG